MLAVTAHAQWQTTAVDGLVSIQLPGKPEKVVAPNGKTTYSLSYAGGDVVVERTTIADSLYLTYGGAENFEFYYKGFLSALAQARLEVTEPLDKNIGDTQVKIFITPRPKGLIQWALFMINKESYLVRFVDPGTSDTGPDRHRIFNSIAIK